jgi:hypothetical protein
MLVTTLFQVGVIDYISACTHFSLIHHLRQGTRGFDGAGDVWPFFGCTPNLIRRLGRKGLGGVFLI